MPTGSDERVLTTEEEVWELLEQTGADDAIAYLVAAALKSDDDLRQQLGDDAPAPTKPASGAAAEPVKAYVKTIAVEGFRGIGAKAVLDLDARPGITVVSGRNGSGKSSFAEALEYAITGRSYRWINKKATFWKESWRNLHTGHPCTINVEFVSESDADDTVGRVQIGVKWAPDADLDAGASWAKIDSGAQQPISALGWDAPVETFRPILSYDEIGGLFDDGPSALYDALNQVLGLDDITDADHRLDAAHKLAGADRKTADAKLRELRGLLEANDDERAATALSLTKRKPYKVDDVAALVVGSGSPQAQLVARLKGIAALRVPTLDDASQRVEDLRVAVAGALAGRDSALELLERRTELLRATLTLTADSDDTACPVCEVGELTDEWRRRTDDAIADADRRLADHRAASQALAEARRVVTAMIDGLPAPAADGLELSALEPYLAAVESARALPDALSDWAPHVESTMIDVADCAGTLASQAAEAAREREDTWSPVAAKLIGWVDAERVARAGDESAKRVADARKWLNDNAAVLRSRRLAPVAAQARRIWGELRQESNVDIEGISLEGRATRRRALVTGAVDGESAGVLSVMSQGELHALALALFIPRATASGSPFGFLILDDPIQAMDPAKIDGFLTVLRELATTRQVIVFSHDDRLPAAIRQLGVDATLLEVSREPGSSVLVKQAQSPAKRYAEDAFALVVDEHVDDAVKAKAAPGLFRMAVEAAARQRFYAQSPSAGRTHTQAEALWEAHRKTGPRVALAVYGDPSKSIGSWHHAREHRGNVMSICTKGVHQGQPLSRRDITDLRKTVDDLLAGS